MGCSQAVTSHVSGRSRLFAVRGDGFMFYRFGGALVLLVIIALGGIAIEKQNLTLRRAVSHQKFRQDVLLEEHAVHRLKAQQLGSPGRLIDDLDEAEMRRPQGRPPVPPVKFKRPVPRIEEDAPLN